jgi:hypothetical protein
MPTRTLEVVISGDSKPFGRAINKADRDTKQFNASLTGLHDSVGKFNKNMTGMRNVVSLVKMPALITGAGLAAQAVSSLGAAAVATGSQLGSLSGAVAAYPAAASAFVQAAGTITLATQGVTDALGGLNEKVDKNKLAKLTPEAQKFVLQLNALKPAVIDIQRLTQRNLFKGVTEGLRGAPKLFDVFRTGAGRTATALGDLAAKAGKLATSRGVLNDLATQMDRNVKLIRRGGDTGLHLANALRNIVIAAGPMVSWMSKLALSASAWVDRQVAAARESGKLAAFFHDSQIQMSRLVHIGTDLATAFWNITKAGRPLGNQILRSLVLSADKFREWTASARGRNAIVEWFKQAHDPVFELGRLLRDATKAFFRLGRGEQIAPIIRSLRTDLLPVLEQVIGSTTKSFGPILVNTATQLLKLFGHLAGTSGPLNEFVRLIGRVAEGMNHLLDKFPALNSAVVTLAGAGGLAKALKLTAAITGVKTLAGLVGGIGRGGAGLGGGGAGTVSKAQPIPVYVVNAAGLGAAAGGGGKAAGAITGATGAAGGAASRLAPVLRAAGPIAGAGAALKVGSDFIQGSAKVDTAVKVFEGDFKRLRDAHDRVGLKRLASDIRHYADVNSDAFKDSGKFARQYADTVEHALDRTKTAQNDGIRALRDMRRDLRSNWKLMSGYTDISLKDIRENVREQMRAVRDRLGTDSEAGRKALATNFRLAARAVRDRMHDGEISTRQGTRQIRRYLIDALKSMGLSGEQAAAKVDTGTIQTRSSWPTGRRRPGWPDRRGRPCAPGRRRVGRSARPDRAGLGSGDARPRRGRPEPASAGRR